MALTGRLDNLTVGDVLHLLASGAKSGKLSLTQPGAEGVIVLRRGKIIYAASNAIRETLGSMLLSRGMISGEQLSEALAIQSASEKEERLGRILLAADAVTQEQLEEVVGKQIQRVLAEFLNWKRGFFRFENLEIPDCGEVEVAAPDFLIDRGLRADTLLIELAEELESESPEPQERGNAETPTSTPFTSLKRIMTEFRSPACTGEITSQILGYAQSLVTRGVLFSAGPLGFAVVGHFGFDSSGESRVRKTRVPLAEPSILREAIARKSIYVGEMKRNAANRDLVGSFGGVWPEQVMVAPLIVSGRIMMILYGDREGDGTPISPTERFDLILLHAGLAIERTLLEKRIAHAERLREQQ